MPGSEGPQLSFSFLRTVYDQNLKAGISLGSGKAPKRQDLPALANAWRPGMPILNNCLLLVVRLSTALPRGSAKRIQTWNTPGVAQIHRLLCSHRKTGTANQHHRQHRHHHHTSTSTAQSETVEAPSNCFKAGSSRELSRTESSRAHGYL